MQHRKSYNRRAIERSNATYATEGAYKKRNATCPEMISIMNPHCTHANGMLKNIVHRYVIPLSSVSTSLPTVCMWTWRWTCSISCQRNQHDIAQGHWVLRMGSSIVCMLRMTVQPTRILDCPVTAVHAGTASLVPHPDIHLKMSIEGDSRGVEANVSARLDIQLLLLESRNTPDIPTAEPARCLCLNLAA
jgi:hypothetical protein